MVYTSYKREGESVFAFPEGYAADRICRTDRAGHMYDPRYAHNTVRPTERPKLRHTLRPTVCPWCWYGYRNARSYATRYGPQYTQLYSPRYIPQYAPQNTPQYALLTDKMIKKIIKNN